MIHFLINMVISEPDVLHPALVTHVVPDRQLHVHLLSWGAFPIRFGRLWRLEGDHSLSTLYAGGFEFENLEDGVDNLREVSKTWGDQWRDGHMGVE